MSLIQFLLVGLVAGWVMGRLRRGKGYGLFGNILIGGIGALIGAFVGGFLGVAPTNPLASVALAVLGAVIFFIIIDVLRPAKKRSSGKENE